jgi:hypothetical protein
MLILMPLFVSLIAITALWLFSSRFWILKAIGWGLLSLVVLLALYSLPNRSVSEVTRGHTLWPETQDMREIVRHWGEHPAGDAPTYVFYGAVPAFRYYARFYGFEDSAPLPPTWYSTCWSGSPAVYCNGGRITYGAWVRNRSPSDMIASIRETMGGIPERYWLIFSHTVDEDRVIVENLQDEYVVEEEFRRVGAVAYLMTTDPDIKRLTFP